ncbi:antibiotic biosynthesis monooxygenase [Alkalihalobacillus oceani]|uniref:putative quinol monooxygenase n=1 Tax=Halalkalibacter oceani TaxID=1653776 RepID=UPI00203AFD34|nr:antibiotic biosynthesis monooxygenase [Halalkalibacter oceani]MCM3760639.1 antibiotic biosynthesis monooxygenase [Halalkalibacter oceani]
MVNVGLYVRLEAKPEKEGEIETFLRGSLPIIQSEKETVAWFALRLGPTTYGIFNAFPDDAGRQKHLSGLVAEELMKNAPDLFTQPPTIESVDVLAVKLPQR